MIHNSSFDCVSRKVRALYTVTRRHKQTIQGKSKLRSSSWWEKEVKGGKPGVVCPSCHAVYFDEHWHTASDMYESLHGRKGVVEKLCLACAGIKSEVRGNAGFAGEVILKGLTDPEKKAEAIRQARNVGARASRRDPEDQIIKIEDTGALVRITTTENQLAVSIGKQINSAHKGGKLEIKWSKEDKPARVMWTAPFKS